MKTSPNLGYYLGCPIWGSAAWGGIVYPHGAKRTSWLNWYSRAFNTVEGNSVFYSLPSREAAARWCDETIDGFQFCFKVPREISHEARLVDCREATDQLFDRLQTLQDRNRLGPTFLQLPPSFSFAEFGALVEFVATWPKQFPLALEVRHADYFDGDRQEGILNAVLRNAGVDLVLFDSRPLFSAPPSTAAEFATQSKKPKTPHRTTVTARRPMLRLIGRDRPEAADPWIAEWAPIVAGWLESGLTPAVFAHAPNDEFAPALARRFHAAVRQVRPQLPELAIPDFSPPEKDSRQRRLF